VSGDLIEWAGEWARRLIAVVVCLAPRRHWARFESLPLSNMAAVSAVLTILAGGALGVSGYFAYMQPAAAVTNTAALAVAEKQARGEARDIAEIDTSTLRMLSLISFLGFALFTPVGLASIYMVLGGCLRAAAYVVNEPLGDPLLTGLDALVHRIRTTTRVAWRRRRRERLEGRETPDILVTGTWAGVVGADYVVISSRQKAGWTTGTFVITRDTWYRLGEPFDLRLPEGLRKAYPLTALQTTEVLRRGVRYELPPLRTPQGRS